MRDARTRYFDLNGFAADGGYEERWIKVKMWRLPIWLPNTKGRRKAVRLHDLHHVLTEYPTTWRGEAEISAWEIGGGGLQRYYAGWVLDLMNVAQGLVINPRGVYRAFMRGRQNANLYRSEFSDELLSQKVGEFRQRLRLDEKLAPASWKDRLAFLACVTVAIGIYAGALLLTATPFLLLLSVLFLGIRALAF